jgi:TolB protein
MGKSGKRMNRGRSNYIVVTNESSERKSEMGTQTTIRAIRTGNKARSAVLLALATILSALVAVIAGTARQAEAAFTEKVVFASNRTTGTGVNNPTGDIEIFRMNPDGTGVRQLTTNRVADFGPTVSPDKTKIAYHSYDKQTSNPEGDYEIYTMRALDAANKKNLTNNGVEVAGAEPVYDGAPDFSPDGDKLAYYSYGKQTSNPEGDSEIYRLNTLDGSGQTNLTNTGADIYDGVYPD